LVEKAKRIERPVVDDNKDERITEVDGGKKFRCRGDICWELVNDEIVVTVDKGAEPECAKSIAEYLLQGKRTVRFDVVDTTTERK
jgi:hypothetical protein